MGAETRWTNLGETETLLQRVKPEKTFPHMGAEALEVVEVTVIEVIEVVQVVQVSETEALLREVRAATRFPDDRMFAVLAKLKQLNLDVYYDAMQLLGKKFMPPSLATGCSCSDDD